MTAVRSDSPLVNLRDVGGLPADGGRKVTRPGVLLRSDAPYGGDNLTAQLLVWPSDVIDLRTADEPGTPFPWLAPVAVHHLALLRQAAPAVQRGDKATLYLHVVDDLARRVAELIAIVAWATGPTLVHCAVGKDRSGVAVAILLDAAGVDRDAIIDDYVATAANVGRLLHRVRSVGYDVDDDGRRRLYDTPRSAIKAVLDRVDSRPRGVYGWLTEQGCDPADIGRWRAKLSPDR